MRGMSIRRFVLSVGVLSTSLLACGPPPKDPAVQTYERFVSAVRGRRSVVVWQLLSPSSQSALALRLGLKPGATEADVVDVLGLRPGWQFELDLPQQARLDPGGGDVDRRVVIGPLGGKTLRIPIQKVDGTWRIDLFAASPASTDVEGIDRRPEGRR
jgi:hypothetical protein